MFLKRKLIYLKIQHCNTVTRKYRELIIFSRKYHSNQLMTPNPAILPHYIIITAGDLTGRKNGLAMRNNIKLR